MKRGRQSWSVPAAWTVALGGWMAVATADVWDWDDNFRHRATELVHGAEQLHELGRGGLKDPGGRDVDHFAIGQAPLASYEVLVDGVTRELADEGLQTSMVVERFVFPSDVPVQTGQAAFSGLGRSRSLRWQNTLNSAVSTALIRVGSTSPCIGCSSSRAAYAIRAYETTYRAPRFNNTSTQVTVLLVQNASDNAISGSVHFWNAGGVLAGSHPFLIAPKQLLLLNTSSLPFAVGVSGSLTVSHDGRYGDLTGKAVAVEPATGFSFDTLLEPRPR